MNAITAQIDSRAIAVHNPATGESIGEVPSFSPQEVNAAVKRAAAAQPLWTATPLTKRLRVLREFQQLLCRQKEKIAEVISHEAGKPRAEALSTEVLVVLDSVNFLLDHVPAFLRAEEVPHANPIMKLKRGRLLRQPYGVIGIISPWNYPFSLPSVQTLTALVTGNA